MDERIKQARLLYERAVDAARQRLEESTQLRREIGQLPGASDAQNILEQVSEARAALPAQPGRRPA